jgi:hypothetical protein
MLAGKIGYFRATAHPEAADWRTRVIANGGTVSASTFAAVETFCRSIDAAGLRSLLWRVSPMAGGNLSAALVPLYRSNTPLGLQGNATDTNSNFVSTDYTETSGLIGNGSSKTLDTGLPQNFSTNRHIGVVPYTNGTVAFRYFAGARSSGFAGLTAMYIGNPVTRVGLYNYNDAGNAAGGGGEADIVLRRLAVSVSDTTIPFSGARTYSNAVSGNAGAAQSTTNATTIALFAIKQDGGTFNSPSNARLSGYTIGGAMTEAQVATYNGIWTTLLTALGRVEPTVSNADAQSWIDRVYANGGTVSTSTASAVNTFCNAIDSAGIRNRFFRMNLFAGNSLASALVPLYRGQSLGGTQFGNATDTNSNFVAGDYSETSGLKGNGSNKHLLTGLLPGDMGGPLHQAFSIQSDATVNDFVMGCDNAFDAGWTSCVTDLPSVAMAAGGAAGLRARGALSSNQGAVGATILTSSSVVRYIATSPRTSGSGLSMYQNGTLSETRSPTYATHPVFQIAVFGGNRKGTVVARSRARLSSYSIGLDITAGQAAAYNAALVDFLAALGRATA